MSCLNEVRRVICNILKNSETDLTFVDISGVRLVDPNYVLIFPSRNFNYHTAEKENVPIVKGIKTVDLLNEFNRKYYLVDNLVVITEDGKILPPHEIHDEWLNNNGYSLTDSRIYIIPSLIYQRDFEDIPFKVSREEAIQSLNTFISDLSSLLGEEIYNRFISNRSPSTISYLRERGYLNYLTPEQLTSLSNFLKKSIEYQKEILQK